MRHDIDVLCAQLAKGFDDPHLGLRFAAAGWQDALLYDSEFISRLNRPEHTKPASKSEPPTCTDTPADILESLSEFTDAQDTLTALRSLAKGSQACLRVSDPIASSEQDQNVLVVGAGPVGLIAALILNNAMGEHATVRILDNRVDEAGLKKPYDRDWLTHLEFAPLAPLLPEDVMAMLSLISGDRLGAPINLIETLLLIAARRAGVACHFMSPDEYHHQCRQPLKLVIDASGGGWTDAVATQAASAPQHVNLPAEKSHGAAFVSCGYPMALDHGPMSMTLTMADSAYASPILKGRPIEVAMAKITGVPAACRADLVRHIANQNADHKFYVWSGNLDPSINELLIIVKLTRGEHTALASAIAPGDALDIADVLSGVPRMSSRWVSLLKCVQQVCPENVNPRVQPPFVYAPRWLASPQNAFEWRGAPVIKLGDSAFNGNPISGNGLTGHIHQLQQLSQLASDSVQEKRLDAA